MTNRFAAAARWLAEQAKIYFWPGPARKRKRRRTTGVLKAVLTVLKQGPCPVNEIVAQVSALVGTGIFECGGVRFELPVYTRAQVLSTLRYAASIGKVLRDDKGRWALVQTVAPPEEGDWRSQAEEMTAKVLDAGFVPEAASGCAEVE